MDGLFLCLWISLPWWTACSPGQETCQHLCCSLSLFGIQYRCDYSNRRLISGPRTRIFIAGQEVLSVVSGAVPTIFCLPLASVILFSVHLCPWRGPTPTLSASPPRPPALPAPISPTHALSGAAVLPALAKNNHHGCIATSLGSLTPPPPPTPLKVPQL